MPRRIIGAAFRAEIARLTISLIRNGGADYLGTRMVGSSADDVLLCCAILIGQVDGRLMPAGKLAEFVGIPRPTVVRKLRELEKRGLVRFIGSIPKLPVEMLNQPAVLRAAEDARKDIHRAAAKLSKMDT